jgi:hypothetical protein
MTKLNIPSPQHRVSPPGYQTQHYSWRKFTAIWCCSALAAAAAATGQDITADLNVQLRPVIEHIDVVTDINVVGKQLFVCTQPGQLYRKDLLANGGAEVFLDLRSEVGRLGSNIPGLPGLGYPLPGTYDERGLLGFAADPNFDRNGRFWVWYSDINEHSASPPGFFQWMVSTSQPWNMAEYDHVDHLAEYRVVQGTPTFQRTLLKIKRPYFNHTGFQSLAWSPELNTLVLALGDGGSEYDPNNIAQDDTQLSGKFLKIDLNKLEGVDFTASAPVATFADLAALQIPDGAFTTLVKGLRNPSKVHYERIGGAAEDNGHSVGKGRRGRGHDDDNGEGDDDRRGNPGPVRWIKYLANTGQDTIEFIHGFDKYGLNFGFRPWEGIFPTSFENGSSRVIAYGLEASRLPNFYRPLVEYTHLDLTVGPNANTGSALYKGQTIPGLKGQLVFTDWISFVPTPQHGLLMHAPVNRQNLQEAQPVKLFNVDLSEAKLQGDDVLFYTSIDTDPQGERIFVGGFKKLQFIVNQRDNPVGAGGVYEVIPQ